MTVTIFKFIRQGFDLLLLEGGCLSVVSFKISIRRAVGWSGYKTVACFHTVCKPTRHYPDYNYMERSCDGVICSMLILSMNYKNISQILSSICS